MRAGTRWVVDGFLAEVNGIKLNDPLSLPLYKVDRLLRLARMVVVDLVDEVAGELEETDGEVAALLELADVTDQWCWHPTDPLLILRCLAARRAHCAALAAKCVGG